MDRRPEYEVFARVLTSHAERVFAGSATLGHLAHQNVLTFYGVGGIGKTELSRRLEGWLLREPGMAGEWEEPPRFDQDVRPVRIDFHGSAVVDVAEIMLKAAGGCCRDCPADGRVRPGVRRVVGTCSSGYAVAASAQPGRRRCAGADDRYAQRRSPRCGRAIRCGTAECANGRPLDRRDSFSSSPERDTASVRPAGCRDRGGAARCFAVCGSHASGFAVVGSAAAAPGAGTAAGCVR